MAALPQLHLPKEASFSKKKKKKIKELLLGKMLGREYNKLYVPIIHEFLFPIIITVK